MVFIAIHWDYFKNFLLNQLAIFKIFSHKRNKKHKHKFLGRYFLKRMHSSTSVKLFLPPKLGLIDKEDSDKSKNNFSNYSHR